MGRSTVQLVILTFVLAVVGSSIVSMAHSQAAVKRTVKCTLPTQRVNGAPFTKAEIKYNAFYEAWPTKDPNVWKVKQLSNRGKTCVAYVNMVPGTTRLFTFRVFATDGTKSAIATPITIAQK